MSTATTAAAAPVCSDDGCAVPTPAPAAAAAPSDAKASTTTATTTTSSSAAPSDVRTYTIDVVSDNICPWCYVGKKRLEKALSRVDSSKAQVRVVWHPFMLDPTLPTPGVDKMTHYARKFGKERIDAMIPHMKAVGREDGIKFSYEGKVGNTLNSHRLVEYAKRFGGAGGPTEKKVIEALFTAYFENEKDISDETTLVDCAVAAGLNADETRKFLRSDEQKSEVLRAVHSASASGISGVPHFTIDGKASLSGGQAPETFLSVFKRVGIPLTTA